MFRLLIPLRNYTLNIFVCINKYKSPFPLPFPVYYCITKYTLVLVSDYKLNKICNVYNQPINFKDLESDKKCQNNNYPPVITTRKHSLFLRVMSTRKLK